MSCKLFFIDGCIFEGVNLLLSQMVTYIRNFQGIHLINNRVSKKNPVGNT